MRLLRATMAALALALAQGLWAQAAQVTLELRREVLLNQPQMTLADLARIEAADPAQAQALGRVVLGQAPLAGQLEQRSRAELDMVLRGQALALGLDIAWRGAAGVRIRSERQQLDGQLLLELATAQLRQELGHDPGAPRLEARLAAPLPDLAAPAGALEYRARLVDPSRPRARMAVWIDVIAHGAVYRSVLVPLAVSAHRDVYVARRALAAGSVAAAADFEQRDEDVAALADAPLAPGTLARGGRVRQALAGGQVVTARQMAPNDMVLRGDHVRLVSQGGGIAVETGATALADALVGQQVRVRPERSNEMVTARVMAPDLVSIEGR
jgi:flagella basal body P-ring formation protein FlgA